MTTGMGRPSVRAAGRPLLVLAAIGLALVFLLAACSQASSGGSATAAAPVDPKDAGLLYAQCMRAKGVPNFPDPGPNGRFAISHGEGGIDHDDPKLRAALEACRDLAPGGEHRNIRDPAYVEQMRKFSQCMRDNGLPDFPDPDADGRLRGLGHEQQGNPKLRAAMEACAEALPGGGAHR